jgi:hypothetical protein
MAREAKFIVAIGRKGVGKTYKTLEMISAVVKGNPKTGRKGEKVLILDTNGEYGDVIKDHQNPNFVPIKALDIKDVAGWTHNGIIDARRILPVKTGNQFGVLNTKEMQETLSHILKYFKGGMFVIEDPTKFISDSLPSDLIGALATQRHKSVDIVLHFQDIGKAGQPKIWANSNMIRFHKSDGTVKRHENKFGGHTTHLYILEKLVDIEYKKGNVRFCATLDKDDNKIKGAFTKAQFVNAIEEYLQDNITLVNREIARVNLRSGVKVHANRAKAVEYLINEYVREYYGNKDSEPQKKP